MPKIGVQRKKNERKSLDIEKQRIESQLNRNERDIQQKDIEIAQTQAQIGGMESRINTIPGVRVALEGVNNRYETSKTNYEELVKKMQDAESQVQVENNAQGETIRVVDRGKSAAVAGRAEKRHADGLGAASDLVIGLFLAGIFEIPRLIQNSEYRRRQTLHGIAGFGSVPPLLSHREKAWQTRLALMKVMAGVAAAIAKYSADRR